jgi:hypothetical protein
LIAASYLRRGAGIWLGVRTIASLMTFLAGGNPLSLSFGATVATIAVSGALGLLETHRRHERALLGNLGVTMAMLTIMLVAPALLGELSLLAIVGRFL